MNIIEIFPQEGHIQKLYCDECGGYLDLTFRQFNENVSGVEICIDGLPYLSCKKCNIHYLPDDSRFAIIYLHKQAMEKQSSVVTVNRKKTNIDYEFTNIQFVYDSDDYKYIPGLKRQFDEGFLTPVFFNRTVLLKYDVSPTYHLSFASTTYGRIRQGDDFSIPFGVNKNNNVVMWLGDIATLPENEQYYLRSENIDSDHSIGSEFYDGQIMCKFTEHTKEESLFAKRSKFLEECFKRFGIKIAHLDQETYDLAISFNAPVVDTERERHYVADALNKIYLESFDNNALGKLLNEFSVDSNGLGSIKKLEKLIEQVANSGDVSKLLSPFYVLYDLRVMYSHLMPKKESEKKLQKVKERLDIGSDAGLVDIYNELIVQLDNSYDKFTSYIEQKS